MKRSRKKASKFEFPSDEELWNCLGHVVQVEWVDSASPSKVWCYSNDFGISNIISVGILSQYRQDYIALSGSFGCSGMWGETICIPKIAITSFEVLMHPKIEMPKNPQDIPSPNPTLH